MNDTGPQEPPSGNKPNGLIQVFSATNVLPDAADIECEVARIRASSNGDAKELSKNVVRYTTQRMTGIGTVAALPGVVPAFGTLTQIAVSGSTLTSETWLLLRNLSAMQLTVAGLHGHDVNHPDRLDELLIVWALQTGVILPATEVGKRLGTKVAIKQFNQHVGSQVFRRINQKVGTTVVTKWGVKRGGVAVGRLIPFGVGAAVGGGVNYLTARSFGAALIRYYTDLLPGDKDVVIVA
jgi:hypothetical protein